MDSYQKEIKLLDHGFVRYIDHLGSDHRILEAARVSYKSKGKGEIADKKLLEYLYKNLHTSPFEQVNITFNIKMPLFVFGQYVRHRMQSLNVVSARYTQLPHEFYYPSEWRKQDIKNKQGSKKENNWNPEIYMVHKYHTPVDSGDEVIDSKIKVSDALRIHCDNAYQLYELMLNAGVSREMARVVLPQNIYTEFYATWDLKNLLHFITLRDDSHAQLEIQEYAKAIKEILTDLFPWSMEAYNKYKFKLTEVV